MSDDEGDEDEFQPGEKTMMKKRKTMQKAQLKGQMQTQTQIQTGMSRKLDALCGPGVICMFAVPQF